MTQGQQLISISHGPGLEESEENELAMPWAAAPLEEITGFLRRNLEIVVTCLQGLSQNLYGHLCLRKSEKEPSTSGQGRTGEQIQFSLHLKTKLPNLHMPKQYKNQTTAILLNLHFFTVLQPNYMYKNVYP